MANDQMKTITNNENYFEMYLFPIFGKKKIVSLRLLTQFFRANLIFVFGSIRFECVCVFVVSCILAISQWIHLSKFFLISMWVMAYVCFVYKRTLFFFY